MRIGARKMLDLGGINLWKFSPQTTGDSGRTLTELF